VFVECESVPFHWRGDAQSWVFARLPDELAADIAELAADAAARGGAARRGLGSVRVEARIGASEWRTSVFPQAEPRGYVLPLKSAVRKAEGVVVGAPVAIRIRLLDL